MNRRVSLGLAGTALVAALTGLAAVAGPRPMNERDLLDFVWLADPQVSPDHRQIAFVRVVVDRARDAYVSSVWVVPADGSAPMRPFTSGPRDTSPRWSPDGRSLTFLRAGEKDDKPEPAQIFALDLTGGEPVELVHLPSGVNGHEWAPDSRHLAVVSLTRPADGSAEPGRLAPSDVRIITRATFRFNGAGYRDPAEHSRIFLVTLADGAGRPTTHPLPGTRISEQEPVFSPDSQTLYFTSRDVEEADFTPPHTLVYEAAVAGGAPRLVATVDGQVSGLAPSPDGRHLASIGALNGSTVTSYHQPDLVLIETATGRVINLTDAYDFDIGGELTGDERAPRGGADSPPVWKPDGAAIRVISAAQGRANVISVDVASRKTTPVTDGPQEVQAFSSSPDGALGALLIASPTNIGDLYTLSPDAGLTAPPRRITEANQAMLAGLDLPEPQEFSFASFDGRQIEGWIITPPGFDPSRRYPLILQIHGGPHAAYGYTFTHEFLAQAGRGYVILYVNPRGSTTYGQEFGNIIQYRYPGDDFKDLMRAVDVVVERGYIDPERMGVTGGSGGGLLTNWTVGHTTRFRAAVSQRSIADWEAWWYAADFTLFRPQWFRHAPWQDRKDFEERSPITYADAAQTPLMLVDGDADLRTPPTAGGEAMFRALKLRHVPVVMVRFPDESHELSRSGRPWHRIDRLRHIANWFDKWLEGKSFPQYDGS
jgi:dipeptidyl aminopeptidase/acylaminoacyl peptidase